MKLSILEFNPKLKDIILVSEATDYEVKKLADELQRLWGEELNYPPIIQFEGSVLHTQIEEFREIVRRLEKFTRKHGKK